MKRCVFLFLTVFTAFGSFAEQNGIRIEIDRSGEKTVAVKESEVAGTSAFVFSFKKQVGLFADKVTVEDAVKGFKFYSEIREKANLYRKEEEKIRSDILEKEKHFKKEADRLYDIYNRKLEPLVRALTVLEKSRSSGGEVDVNSVKQKIIELETARDEEIAVERKKYFPDGLQTNVEVTIEETVEEKLIEEFQLNRSSFSGTQMSLSDVKNSVSLQNAVLSFVPVKNLKLIYEDEKTETSSSTVLKNAAPDFQAVGLRLNFPNTEKTFRFDCEEFLRLLSSFFDSQNTAPVEVSKTAAAQQVGYVLKVKRCLPEEFGLRKTRRIRNELLIPVSFEIKTANISVSAAEVGGKRFVFVLPEKQEGSLAEHVCLIFEEAEVVRLIRLIEEKQKSVGTISVDWDFLSFDSDLKTEVEITDNGAVFPEEKMKQLFRIK